MLAERKRDALADMRGDLGRAHIAHAARQERAQHPAEVGERQYPHELPRVEADRRGVGVFVPEEPFVEGSQSRILTGRLKKGPHGVENARADIGVFGGSGFYSFVELIDEVAVETPYGDPSAPVVIGEAGLA